MTAVNTLPLAVVNTLGRARFVAALDFVFESSDWIVEEAWPARPWKTRAALHRSLCDVMYAAGLDRQLALIRAHPDLVGKAALAGGLTIQSTGEQAEAGLDQLSNDEITRFTDLNRAYHERFDFPFVICARENKKDSILAGFAARLPHSREEEIRAALSEIAKIAWLRLCDAVTEDGEDD